MGGGLARTCPDGRFASSHEWTSRGPQDKPSLHERPLRFSGDEMNKPILNGRRAAFVYDAARLAAAAANAPIVPVPWAEREPAFIDQFLKVIERQCGPQRSSSPVELHGSWMQAYLEMGWVYGETYDVVIRNNDQIAWNGSLPYARSFGDVALGDNLLFINSSGATSIAVNQGNFASKYGVGSGEPWTIEIRKQ